MEVIKVVCLLYIASYFFVFIHELGHYIAVRMCNIRPYNCIVGSGPELYWKTYNKTDFSFRLLPFGGQVAFKRIVTNRQQIAIFAAGPLANLVLAAAIYAVYLRTHIDYLPAYIFLSLYYGVSNLIPHGRSDGKIIQETLEEIKRLKKN